MSRGNFLMTQIPKARAIREGSFGFLIQTLARRLDARMKEELQTIDVDIKVFANLMVLAEEDGINQRMIGERLNFPEYFTSRNIDALVKAGLAERRPDPNSRRAFLVFLTPKGRAKADLLPPIIRKVNEEFLDSLPGDEKKILVGLLQQVSGVGV